MALVFKGATALVTGASSGIGEAFAHLLAKRGTHLILVARSEEALNDIAAQLHQQYGVTVDVMAADLCQRENWQNIEDACEALGRQVDILINNAGFGTAGAFTKQDRQRECDEVDLNVTALTDLCHRFVPGMVERKQGAVLNVASTASFQPLPFMAVYAATKAYVRSLTEAMHQELKPKGVHVTALCPGPVDTGFFAAADLTEVAGRLKQVAGLMMTSEAVAEQGLKALEKNQAVIVTGAANKMGALMTSLTPNKIIRPLAAKFMHR